MWDIATHQEWNIQRRHQCWPLPCAATVYTDIWLFETWQWTRFIYPNAESFLYSPRRICLYPFIRQLDHHCWLFYHRRWRYYCNIQGCEAVLLSPPAQNRLLHPSTCSRYQIPSVVPLSAAVLILPRDWHQGAGPTEVLCPLLAPKDASRSRRQGPIILEDSA